MAVLLAAALGLKSGLHDPGQPTDRMDGGALKPFAGAAYELEGSPRADRRLVVR